MHPGQTLLDLYKERQPLYEKYAHITIDCEGLQLRELATLVGDKVEEAWSLKKRIGEK